MPARRGITKIPGRDYRAADLPLTVALGIGCNAVAMLVLFLYLTNEAMPTGFYRQPYWLWGAAFIVFLWSLRIWGLSHRGKLDADPVAFAIRDRPASRSASSSPASSAWRSEHMSDGGRSAPPQS